MVKYLSFHNFFFFLKILFNVNGKATVWLTHPLFFHLTTVNFKHMVGSNLTSNIVLDFKLVFGRFQFRSPSWVLVIGCEEIIVGAKWVIESARGSARAGRSSGPHGYAAGARSQGLLHGMWGDAWPLRQQLPSPYSVCKVWQVYGRDCCAVLWLWSPHHTPDPCLVSIPFFHAFFLPVSFAS